MLVLLLLHVPNLIRYYIFADRMQKRLLLNALYKKLDKVSYLPKKIPKLRHQNTIAVKLDVGQRK